MRVQSQPKAGIYPPAPSNVSETLSSPSESERPSLTNKNLSTFAEHAKLVISWSFPIHSWTKNLIKLLDISGHPLHTSLDFVLVFILTRFYSHY